MRTKRFKRGRLEVVLDKDEVFEDDPGQGTPAMVYKDCGSKGEYAASVNACLGPGVLLGSRDEIELTIEEIDWIDSIDLDWLDEE
tara:strand:+ start:310 stop:564 length:255 start_codon:yes stop_codon:yes gene_type:complete